MDAALCCKPPHLSVSFPGVHAQLQHIPQYGNFPVSFHILQYPQGSLHRIGTGVVCIIYHLDILICLQGKDMQAHIVTGKLQQTCLNLLHFHTKHPPCRNSRKAVVYIVDAGYIQPYSKAFVLHPKSVGNAVFMALNIYCTKFRMRAGSEANDFAADPIPHHNLSFPVQNIVVIIKYYGTAFMEVLKELRFSFPDIVPAAQFLDVGYSYVCKNCCLRWSNGSQTANFSESAHSHLQNCNLMMRLQPEEGKGQSDFIVQIALGF